MTVDKATSNVAVIFQRFYSQVVVKESGQQISDASNTYCRVFESYTIIKINHTILEKKFNLTFLVRIKDVHIMYWFPKLITYWIEILYPYIKCSVKPLPKLLTFILRLFLSKLKLIMANLVTLILMTQVSPHCISVIPKLAKRS